MPIIGMAVLVAAIIPAVPAYNACPNQAVHTYVLGPVVHYNSGTLRSTSLDDGSGSHGSVAVFDTNLGDCNAWPSGDEEYSADGMPGDWDGDYDFGIGGAFFGYGTWALNDVCDYDLNVHGGSVSVTDVVWGTNVAFLVAEDDKNGPIAVPVTDPLTNTRIGIVCETDESITPFIDADDCISDADNDIANGYTSWVGSGHTCGTGGGDGGYWVFLDGLEIHDSPIGFTTHPTSGTITSNGGGGGSPNGNTGRPYALSKGPQGEILSAP